MTRVITVFEYDRLSAEPVAGAVAIGAAAFSYLESCCLSDSHHQGCISLISRRGVKLLYMQNYAGVLHTPHGVQIEILPKIGKAMAQATARQALFTMLSFLPGFRHLVLEQARVQAEKMPMLEIFVCQFLDSLSQLIRKGLRSEYRTEQQNLNFLKGRWLMNRHLRHNLIQKQRFFVEYEEFSPDNAANRLLHSALDKISGFALSQPTRRWAQELRFVFAEIPPSRNIARDFASLRADRNMKHYQTPLDWARLILDDASPLSMHGDAQAFSLLFPMEAVFEQYVAQRLGAEIGKPFQLQAQVYSETLVNYNGNERFTLKPDLIVKHINSNEISLVMDTKWKMIFPARNGNVGLDQDDFYQLFAYGHKYLGGNGEMFLIYPFHDQFTEPMPYHFAFSDTLKLWVVPFEIHHEKRSCLRWPEKASSTGEIYARN